MCCLRVCKGNFPLRIRRKTPRPPCFRRPFGAGSCSGICRAICAKRDGVFWLREGQRCLSTYRRWGWEFFGCRQGKGVLLPTAVGDGVFWLQAGRGCLSTYRRGGWSFLVAGGARVSLYLPPQRDGVFWLQEGRGCLSTYRRRSREQKNAHPAGGMGGGGRLRAYNWSEADTIRTLCGRVNNLVLAQEEISTKVAIIKTKDRTITTPCRWFPMSRES